MTSTSTGEINDSILELQKNYLKRLAVQLAELRRFQVLFTTGASTIADLRQFYRVTHNYAGSGSTFNFPEISRTARALHDALNILIESDSEKADLGERTRERHDVAEALDAFIATCTETIKKKPAAPTPSVTAAAYEHQPQKRIAIYASKTTELADQLTHFGYEVSRPESLDTLKQSIETGTLHAIVLYSDLSLKDIEDMHSMFRKQGQPTLPLIILSERQDFTTRLNAVRIGAHGFFRPDTDVLKLIDRIEQLTSKYDPSPPQHILVVDPDEMLAEFYAHALRSAGMKVTTATKPKDALELLDRESFDLLLTDITMPHCSGQELATLIRQHERHMGLSIVFMLTQEDIAGLVNNTGLGVDDFLLKPFTPEQLVAIIGSRARRASELSHLMLRDSFTGLLNHTHFLEMLNSELMQARRDYKPTIYASIDIDDFHDINERHGHTGGDQIVKSLGRMLEQRLRRTDIIGRCGSDRFGIVMPGCTLERAHAILETLRTSFADNLFKIGRHKVKATLSAGIVLITQNSQLNRLIADADKALAQAKKQGRNRIAIHAES